LGRVFHYARNRAEFVFHAFDANRGDGRAFNRAQQHAAQAIADRGAEPALKRLGRKHAIPLRKGLGIGDQSFGFLKALKHKFSLEPASPRARSKSAYFEYNSTMSCSLN